MKELKRLGDLPIGAEIEYDGKHWEITGFLEDGRVKPEQINHYDGSALHKWLNKQIDVLKPENKVIPMGFLLSRHELEMGGCPYKYTPWPTDRVGAPRNDWMEGPSWYGEARDKFDARIVGEMVLGKAYLYQLFTTCFLEFSSFGEAKKCYDWGVDNVDYFGYDPVAIIDTSNPDHVERWKKHIVEEASHD